MATLEQIAAALQKADAAGNVEDARALANAYREMQGQAAPKPTPVARTAQQMADEMSLPIPGTVSNAPAPVPRYRSPIPGGDAMNEFATSFAENIPVIGPLMTRGADATGSQIAAMLTGKPADEMLEQGQGMRARNAADDPIAGTAGAVAGSVGPLMSLGTTKLGEQALGIAGPMWQRILAGGASGGLIAGGDAAARGESVGDSFGQGAMGLGLGAAFPLAERAAAPFIRMLTGQKVPTATANIGRNLERDGIDPATLMARIDQMGADEVLADLGPNMQRQAGAIASLPGEGQSILRDALARRSRGANARIQGDVDATFGQATSPRAFNEGIDVAQRELSPVYEGAFANARAVDTDPIALNLDSATVNLRGEAQTVARSLRDMLNVHGSDVLDPNPRTLFEVRKAIDGMYGTVQDGNARRLLTETRRLVDDELASKVPGIKDADARFRQLAETRGAFEQGQSALDSGRSALTPSDLSAVTATAQPHVLDAMSQGTRAEIDRIIGTTANNLTALKGALKGDGSWNRDRLITLFGKDKADSLLNVLEREQRYAQTFDTVTRNSETAARTAAQKEAAPQEFGQTSTSLMDLLLKIPQGAANLGARARSEATNKAIAEMLMGKPTPEMVDQLLLARQMSRGLIGSSATPLLTN